MPKKLSDVDKIFHGAAGLASSAISNIIEALPGSNTRRGNKAQKDTETIKRARSYDNAPNFDDSGNVTDAFKARSLSDEVKKRRMK